MSGSVNQATLLGRLGKDPESRTTAAGTPVVSLRLATSDTWKDKSTGERKERTEWHSVVIFNENLCRIAEQYLKKGANVYVQGKISTRKWQAQDGQDRYATEIVLPQYGGTLTLLDKAERPAREIGGYGSTTTREPARNSYADAKSVAGSTFGRTSAASDLDDDIPF